MEGGYTHLFVLWEPFTGSSYSYICSDFRLLTLPHSTMCSARFSLAILGCCSCDLFSTLVSSSFCNNNKFIWSVCSQRLSLAWVALSCWIIFPAITSCLSSMPVCLIYLFSSIPTYSLSALVTTLPTSAFLFPCTVGKNNCFTTFCTFLCPSLQLRSVYWCFPQQYPSSMCICNFSLTVCCKTSPCWF